MITSALQSRGIGLCIIGREDKSYCLTMFAHKSDKEWWRTGSVPMEEEQILIVNVQNEDVYSTIPPSFVNVHHRCGA